VDRLKKVKSSSLFETLVAMTILVVISGIAMVAFINISRSSVTGEKIKARLFLFELVEKTRQEGAYVDEEFEWDNLMVKKSFIKYEGNPDLLIMKVEIKDDQNRKVAAHREIITADAN
jgi:hypothetical protein